VSDWYPSCGESVPFFSTRFHVIEISDDNFRVITKATYALFQIAQWPNGAQDIVDANALDHVLALLQSPSPDIRKRTCKLVGRLADHEATAPAVSDLKLCVQLAALLR
jgi:HEAT repeat protein